MLEEKPHSLPTRSLPKGASVLNVGALVQYRTGNVQLMVEEMDGY